LRGIPAQDFERMDIQLVFDVIQVDKHLGGIPDSGNRSVRVLSAPQGEISDGIQFMEIRACHAEEVRQEFIGRPIGNEGGEVVKNVENLSPFLFDDAIDLGAEGIETESGVDLLDDHPGQEAEYYRMGSELEPDDGAPASQGMPDEGFRDSEIVVELVHLPDDIVSKSQPVDHFIQSRNPTA
jgi:hypothetical protein